MDKKTKRIEMSKKIETENVENVENVEKDESSFEIRYKRLKKRLRKRLKIAENWEEEDGKNIDASMDAIEPLKYYGDEELCQKHASIRGDQFRDHYGNCIYCILDGSEGWWSEEWSDWEEVAIRAVQLFKMGFDDYKRGVRNYPCKRLPNTNQAGFIKIYKDGQKLAAAWGFRRVAAWSRPMSSFCKHCRRLPREAEISNRDIFDSEPAKNRRHQGHRRSHRRHRRRHQHHQRHRKSTQ